MDFARSYVDHLTVQVCSLPSEPIPGELRYEWMRRAFPDVTVLHNTDENPSLPEECPDRFWDIWRESLLRRMEPADFLFAGEEYGIRLAKELGMRHVPVDYSRELVGISGTRIRSAPMEQWEYILPEARPYFLKRVAIIGPESSGKSTLAKNLARHYNTRFVPEYARGYLDTMGMNFDAEVFETIARGHRASEEAMARQANRVLFCDTESLITKLWAEILLGDVPALVEEYARQPRYALYLVMAATEDWVEDLQRFQPAQSERERFFARCVEALRAWNRNIVILQGSWEERFTQAIRAVDPLLRP